MHHLRTPTWHSRPCLRLRDVKALQGEGNTIHTTRMGVWERRLCVTGELGVAPSFAAASLWTSIWTARLARRGKQCVESLHLDSAELLET